MRKRTSYGDQRSQRGGWRLDAAGLPAGRGQTKVIPPREYHLSPCGEPPVDEGGRPPDSDVPKDGAPGGGCPSKQKERVIWRSRRRWLIGCPLA